MKIRSGTINYQQRENLFKRLDPNYERVFRGRPCLDQLFALDAELAPGCIWMESFDNVDAKNLRTGDAPHEVFHEGENTLVFRCKTEEGALSGAKVLTKIFSGSGRSFVAEELQANGKTVFQIRSNIDKPRWEMLELFCKYRFDREKHNEEEAAVEAAAQSHIDAYLQGSGKWRAEAGIPACVTLMGLHGNLRPSIVPERLKKNRLVRLEQELNAPDGYGVPDMFHNVVMHVNIAGDSDIKLGFDPHRDAMQKVTGGNASELFWLIVSAGNPFQPGISPVKRGISVGSWVGLAMGLHNIGQNIGPLISTVGCAAGAGLTFGVVAYVEHQWRIIDRIRGVFASDGKVKLQSQATGKEVVVKPEDIAKGVDALEADRPQTDIAHSEELPPAVQAMLQKGTSVSPRGEAHILTNISRLR